MNENLPDADRIDKANQYTDVLFNRVLYDMCKNYPSHDNEKHTESKILIIGRAYSASLDRRTDKSIKTEDLYALVAHQLKESDLDDRIEKLSSKNLSDISTRTNDEIINQVLELHGAFMSILESCVKMNKRSLASKYLHFHLPELFFLYDSYAVQELRGIYPRLKVQIPDISCDREYATFYHKMLIFRNEIKAQYEYSLNPRKLDQLLLRY
jgi:hypothetical protein